MPQRVQRKHPLTNEVGRVPQRVLRFVATRARTPVARVCAPRRVDARAQSQRVHEGDSARDVGEHAGVGHEVAQRVAVHQLPAVCWEQIRQNVREGRQTIYGGSPEPTASSIALGGCAPSMLMYR